MAVNILRSAGADAYANSTAYESADVYADANIRSLYTRGCKWEYLEYSYTMPDYYQLLPI